MIKFSGGEEFDKRTSCPRFHVTVEVVGRVVRIGEQIGNRSRHSCRETSRREGGGESQITEFHGCFPVLGPDSKLGGFTFRRVAMKNFAQKIERFLKSEDGPTAVEYAVMLALIVVVCLGAIQTVGTNAKATFTSVSGQL